MHGKSNWKIKGVESGLVANDEVVLVVVKEIQVDTIFGGCKKVYKLTKFGFPGDL